MKELFCQNSLDSVPNVREFLFVEFHRTNYGIYEPVNAAVRGFNEFAGLFDFNITRDTFLKRIKSVS
jgi:hypothetical protein